MSEEQLRAFVEAIKADATLQQKLNAAADADVAVGIAKEAGFVITAEELQRTQAGNEISDKELEGVVGGAVPCCAFLRIDGWWPAGASSAELKPPQ